MLPSDKNRRAKCLEMADSASDVLDAMGSDKPCGIDEAFAAFRAWPSPENTVTLRRFMHKYSSSFPHR